MTALVVSTWNWGRDLIWTRVAGLSVAGWLFFAAANMGLYGLLWDGGWHASWGRDTFFIPPHDLMYAGVTLALGLAGFIVISSSLRARDTRLLQFLRFQAPLGVWILFLGAFVMVLAAPFDDWYHNTFGRDDGSGLWSAPHAMGALGGLVGILGLLIFMLQEQNVMWQAGTRPRGLRGLQLREIATLMIFSYTTFVIGGLSLNFWAIRDWFRFDGTLYPVLAMLAGPATLVLAQRITRRAGAATFIVVYAFVALGFMQLLLGAFNFPVVVSLPVMGIPSAIILDVFYARYGSSYRALLIAAPLAVLAFYPSEYWWAWYLSGQPWWSPTNSFLTLPLAVAVCTASCLFAAWGAERIREWRMWRTGIEPV